MMETRFTSGPWTSRKAKQPVDGEYDFGIFADGAPGCIAEVFGRTSETHRPDAEANAHLISAAPDLYAALEWAMKQLTYARRVKGQNDHYCDAVDRANAALAKARGESAALRCGGEG